MLSSTLHKFTFPNSSPAIHLFQDFLLQLKKKSLFLEDSEIHI